MALLPRGLGPRSGQLSGARRGFLNVLSAGYWGQGPQPLLNRAWDISSPPHPQPLRPPGLSR